MTAFAEATEAIFADENVGEAAMWRTGGLGAGAPCRVIRGAPDAILNFGSSRTVASMVMIDVQASEVATPEAGDTVAIGAEVFRIMGTPIIDALRLVWNCEAKAV